MRGNYKSKTTSNGKKGNVTPCLSCSKEVTDELWALEKNKKTKETKAYQRIVEDISLKSENYASKEELKAESISTYEKKKVVTMKEPVYLFCKRPETAITRNKKDKLKQTNTREACDKEATARVHQYIAQFWH
ncbi:hypothetical protein Fmac_025271 [Flemingia macrophylla]|uniref:Uncharacterized protein n=1 Tax=Flemingia macrophylla TaxID=520843 RepID=A0ABD1LRU2_9FABA